MVEESPNRSVPSGLLRRTWKQFSFPKPVQEESAPLADGGISQIEADAVRRVFKNVEFRRNAGFAQRQIERHAIFGRHHGVRGAAEEKGGRRLRSDVQLTREFLDKLRLGVFADEISSRALVRIFGCEGNHGVGEHGEIRSRTGAIDGIRGLRIP